ncbi:hypothetical protein [Brachyspira aalborgi]|jgi:hypothetical protein|uniref:Uncharacterized protein n=1 Tax=Brachyspira aalborgi TaxID=29522 RepID=A0ABY3K6R5_9SPIR|nr:hypothetical protein [Brachyspira aalborgi]TXJ31143.1 hypothetical protein EPJ71_10440 [Brachyspira aalborgi]TXJ40033.1 hypothetical protein EPJ65_12380 [Brachyspira aalborgi]DAZ18877.1 MAG TPA: hypothetical protein [Caudoviricetes sp.]
MKTKIILIFILFVLSLFSQVEIEDDALFVRVPEYKNKNLHCEIVIMKTGGWAIYFIETDEKINIITTDNYRYNFKSSEVNNDNGFWMSTTISLDNDTQKKILKDIINSEYVIITTEKKVYGFYFSKYKKELENNAFYKKIMQ